METTQDKQDPKFVIFSGRTYVEMPKLIAAGFVPASAAEIMRGRLEGELSFERCRDSGGDSGDAIIYHPKGMVKLVWDSEDLRKLNPKSRRYNGDLVLPDGAWRSIKGEVFFEDRIAKYSTRDLSKNSAKRNPFWRWLARDDQALLDAYVDEMFRRVRLQYGCNHEMGVFLSRDEDSGAVQPLLRLWFLGGVEDGTGIAVGGHLDEKCGCLVGIRKPQYVSSPNQTVLCKKYGHDDGNDDFNTRS